MIGGMYRIEDPTSLVLQGTAQAAQTYGAMGKQRKVETEEDFSAADALQTAMAGAAVASEVKTGLKKPVAQAGTPTQDLETGKLLGGVTPPNDDDQSGFKGFADLYRTLYGVPYMWGKNKEIPQ
jgi:hypothetical protein